MSITVENQFDGSETDVPEHVRDRTENLLGATPMTNQNIIMDTAVWWFEHVGNCPIYRWCIHHLDSLEHDDVRGRVSIYSNACEQARAVGLDV